MRRSTCYLGPLGWVGFFMTRFLGVGEGEGLDVVRVAVVVTGVLVVVWFGP